MNPDAAVVNRAHTSPADFGFLVFSTDFKVGIGQRIEAGGRLTTKLPGRGP